MARWRLTEACYLYTDPPTEWEQKETDLVSGEEVRKRYVVPKYLNPDDPRMKNFGGFCVVCFKGKGEPRDFSIVGPPNDAMMPMDEEAEQISAATQRPHPIESLPAQGDAPPSLLHDLQAQVNALMRANDDLHKRLSAQEEQNTEALEVDLAAHSAQKPKVTEGSVPRRV